MSRPTNECRFCFGNGAAFMQAKIGTAILLKYKQHSEYPRPSEDKCLKENSLLDDLDTSILLLSYHQLRHANSTGFASAFDHIATYCKINRHMHRGLMQPSPLENQSA